ncbi:MAG: TetR/AcrR family transcriptional regulator [Sphingobium sp.]
MPARRGRPRASAALAAGDSREKLIRAATHLFAQHGFEGVSTTMVAEAAELTQPMVHYYFRTKALLWESVVEALVEHRLRTFPLNSNMLVDLDPLSRLKLLAGLRFEINVVEPHLGMIVLHEVLSESPRLKWLVENYLQPAFQALNATAQAAMDAGQLRKVSMLNLAFLFSSAGYLSFAFASVTQRLHALHTDASSDRGAVRDSFVKALFEGLSPKPRAASPWRLSLAEPAAAVHTPHHPSHSSHGQRSDGAEPLDRLMNAGAALFAQHGYAGVTTAMIAERAGLTQSMVNYYFRSKSRFWKAVVERLVQERRVTFPFVSTLATDLSPIVRLKMFLRLLIEANARNPEYGKIFLQEALARSERLAWLEEHYLNDTFKAIDTIAAAAVEAGELMPLPPGHLSNILISAGYQLFVAPAVMQQIYAIDLRDDAAIASLSDDFITILFDGLQP